MSRGVSHQDPGRYVRNGIPVAPAVRKRRPPGVSRVTGGVVHASGGAERTAIVFTPEKVSSRTWRIRLNDLERGEYGFLPPGVVGPSIAASAKSTLLASKEKVEYRHRRRRPLAEEATERMLASGTNAFDHFSVGDYNGNSANGRGLDRWNGARWCDREGGIARGLHYYVHR